MRVLFFIDSFRGLEQNESTLALVQACAGRDNDTYVARISDLELYLDGELRCFARHAISAAGPIATTAKALRDVEPFRVTIRSGDVIILRANPTRDLGSGAIYSGFLDLARVARNRGALVVNDPDGLAKAGSRVYLEHLPASMRPRTVVTRDLQTVLELASSLGETFVLKSLKGTYGRDVFRVGHRDLASLRQIAEILQREGFVVAQEFLPQALEGDLRVLVLDGQILQCRGCCAVVHRMPVKDDFRRNLNAGGRAREAVVSNQVRAIVERMSHQLAADGILLCGMDFVGDKLVEINVFSPGGLWHAQELTGVPFADQIIAAIEGKT